jgi:anti-sigma factor RsiW
VSLPTHEACKAELAAVRAENTELRAALEAAADKLEEVRTGEDFEVECWNVAERARSTLSRSSK